MITPENTTLFWQYKPDQKVYYNTATAAVSQHPPIFPKGGILADEMGLGKTIQVISLILSDPYQTPTLAQNDIYVSRPLPEHPTFQQPAPRVLPGMVDYGKTTLIVCPLSVVGNWTSQFEAHVANDRLKVYVFHGQNRTTDPSFLREQDVVITTYQVLAGDYNKERPLGLLTLPWLRVVLDEAHTIKSKQAKQSLAAFHLRAERRWCLTGTPLQNTLDDLYSLIKFLHITPFDDANWWNRIFTRPIKSNQQVGFSHLQTLMQSLCLRRVKNMEINGKPIVSLPKRTIYHCKVKFTPEELEKYRELENDSKQFLDKYLAQDDVGNNYAHILVILGRLRQFCDHPALCTKEIDDLSAILQNSECEDCSLCYFPITQPVITPCAHLYCRQCIERALMERSKCPMCSADLTKKDLLDEESSIKSKKAAAQQVTSLKPSSKVSALIQALENVRMNDPLVKSVIFSQWTSMLNLLEVPLRRSGLKFVRLDGTMTRAAREAAITKFENDSDVTVFLISLKCGGLGLNLTAASQVFMMDPWWNPSAEDQAIDRVHRIGQTKNVVVVKFIVEGSVEERVVELQSKKRQLMEQAFGADKKDNRRESRIADLNFLLKGILKQKS